MNKAEAKEIAHEAAARLIPGSGQSRRGWELLRWLTGTLASAFAGVLGKITPTDVARLQAILDAAGQRYPPEAGPLPAGAELEMRMHLAEALAEPFERGRADIYKVLVTGWAHGYALGAVEAEARAGGAIKEAAAGPRVTIPFDLPIAPEVLVFAERYCATLVTRLEAESVRELARILTVAMGQDRRGVPDVARALRGRFPEFSRTRADLIARTEMARAMSGGALEREVSLGARMKDWITVGDNLVSDVCQANESQGEIPAREPFESGDMHPPAHPRCRCAVGTRGATRASVAEGMSALGVVAWVAQIGWSMGHVE